MDKSKKSVTIIVRVSEDTKADLQKLADKDSRKLSDYVRLELEKHIKAKKED